MVYLLYATLALGACYLLLIVAFSIGLFRTFPTPQATGPTVTVVVPARNEACTINACLDALAAQAYPPDRFEIVLVDDRSTDGTADIARQWAVRMPNLKIATVRQQRYACPKKNALWHGIQIGTGELIFTTDADCRPGPNWIAATVRRFAPDVGMVIGHAPLVAGPGLKNRLLVLQSLIVAALSAGSVGIGVPLACSGRNLAYRRRAFDDVNGFESIGHIVGGDDVLLMRRIARTPWKMRFNFAPEAAVVSAAHPDSQMHRQVRYQSKAVHYGAPILIPALAIYLFHLILFLYPAIAWYAVPLRAPIGLALALKTVADGMFLHLASRRLGTRSPLRWIPLLEIAIIPYTAIICALGALAPFKWK